MLLDFRLTADSNPSLSATQSGLQRNKAALLQESLKIAVIVSLIANDQEYDHVSLDMAQDFQKIELSTYALHSEILLQGLQATAPIQ